MLVIKSSNFLLKNINYLLQSCIFNIKYISYNTQVTRQTYHFKFLNMCKFTHDRKTHDIILTKLITLKLFRSFQVELTDYGKGFTAKDQFLH